MAKEFETFDFGPPSSPGVYAVCIAHFSGFIITKERIVYIGSSKNIRERVMNPSHPYRKLYDRMTGLDFIVYTKGIETDDYKNLEMILIKKHKPLLNKQLKNGQ